LVSTKALKQVVGKGIVLDRSLDTAVVVAAQPVDTLEDGRMRLEVDRVRELGCKELRSEERLFVCWAEQEGSLQQ
jgi:hypothetical protein